MNSTLIKKDIEQNLQELYLSWTVDKDILLTPFDTVLSIKSKQTSWPNYIINKLVPTVDFEQNIKELNRIVAQSKTVEFWIVNSDLAFPHEELLRKNNFFPIKIWTGMHLSLKNVFEKSSIEDFEIASVNQDNLKEWINIVNSELYTIPTVSAALFKTKLADERFQLLIGKYKGEVVSTILSFTNLTTTGLYYVATKRAYRKRGFGTALFKRACNEALAKGNRNLVLHASKMAVSLYKKLGFISYNKILIFSKK